MALELLLDVLDDLGGVRVRGLVVERASQEGREDPGGVADSSDGCGGEEGRETEQEVVFTAKKETYVSPRDVEEEKACRVGWTDRQKGLTPHTRAPSSSASGPAAG